MTGLQIIKPDAWNQVTQLVRLNESFLPILNEVNARFDKPIFLDDKDWLQTIFSTLYNFTWEDIVIITHHAFIEPNLTRTDNSDKMRVYFYTLPNIKDDKLKEEYEVALYKIFNKKIEGVQIYGNNDTTKEILNRTNSTATIVTTLPSTKNTATGKNKLRSTTKAKKHTNSISITNNGKQPSEEPTTTS